MSASEGGQVNSNYPAQDEKFQANPAHDVWIQKSLSSDRVAPVKQLEELVERRMGCSSGIVKDQPSLLYEHTVDSELPLKLQIREYCAVSTTHKIDNSYIVLQLVKLAPELSKLPGEHESVYMWVLSCYLFHKYIRLFSRDVSVFHHANESCSRIVSRRLMLLRSLNKSYLWVTAPNAIEAERPFYERSRIVLHVIRRLAS